MDLPTIVNLALQGLGTRTDVTAGELAANSSNEAIQANLAILQTRDELLRMAPWDCCSGTIDLNYITSAPSTPENQSAPVNQTQWTPGLPLPPWVYEYQYPVDCLRACSIVAQNITGVNGVPIYPSGTSTGYAISPAGPAVKFKVGNDNFYSATAASIVTGGAGYAVGDLISLALGPVSLPPIGAPAILQVTSVAAGVVTGVSLVNTVINAGSPASGSYFAPQTGQQYQGTTTGVGTGIAVNLTFGGKTNQRVILTNQEFAVLNYNRQITDPNVMDPLFLKAWYNVLGAALCMALTGDKGLANGKIQLTNQVIMEARAVDGNEGLTINDVTPDWIRARGINFSDNWNTGSAAFDWGAGWAGY